MTNERDSSGLRFGHALAKSRIDAGITQEALGRAIGRSGSHISNVESGRRPLVPVDVRAADEALAAQGRLVRLHAELYEQGSLDWLDNLAELQAEAEIIREWHPTLVPGLLQTEAYASAIVASSAPWRTPDSVAEKVEQRLRTAERVLGGPTPHYHVVIDDVAAMRPVGPPKVMAGQLRALVDLAQRGRVMIQFHRFALWPHAGLSGPFSVLSSASAPDTVHVESVYRGQATDDPKTVRQTFMSFSRLQASARGPHETVEYLDAMIKEYEHDAWPLAQK